MSTRTTVTASRTRPERPPRASTVADDVQRQHDLTKRQHDLTNALETATRFRKGADTRWRAAIAEALAAGVPRDLVLKAAGGWDVIEVQDILRDLDQRKT
jgi:hypothetical protein